MPNLHIERWGKGGGGGGGGKDPKEREKINMNKITSAAVAAMGLP